MPWESHQVEGGCRPRGSSAERPKYFHFPFLEARPSSCVAKQRLPVLPTGISLPFSQSPRSHPRTAPGSGRGHEHLVISASRKATMTRALEEALLQHFIHQKLEIAYAINKPFPFFEGLRDNSFITERLYRESMEAWENLVPLCRVVYNILTQLEKTFSLSFLKILFSRINLKAYPNLITALSSFTRVVTSHGGWSRNTTIPLEAPANPAGKSSSRTLLLPCLPCRYPLRSLPPCAPSVSKPRAPAQHSSEVLREMPSPTDLTVALRGTIQEGRLRPVRRDDVPEPSDPKELQEASRTLPSKKGATLPGHGIQKTLQGLDQVTHTEDNPTRNTKVVTRAQKRTECAPMPKSEEISDNTSEMDEGKRPQEPPSAPPRITHGKEKKRKIHNWSSSKKRQKKCLSKEKPKDETFDFHSPELPVTCGEAKGILYKEKMKQGSSEKCIQNEKGVWFTPNEFEIEGKRKRSKNWKRSVFCGGNSLEKLLQKGILICPSSRKHLKTEQENSKECEVCCKGGSLLRCDTCPRFFHEDCHIPPSEAERSPWSCTFCRIKESSGNQQGLQESEVRARSMQPEEQLKCEFLLLKAYCHPQSSFFAETPCNIRDYGEPFREAMWLDLVKERLTEKVYTMAWFLRDMRLIFHNHKTFFKLEGKTTNMAVRTSGARPGEHDGFQR
uniref:Sp110 nuclear body protein n=1 Tax=Capra hircus TaxID=9925 RepID=A0A8C2ND95_CAPHI